jgi:Ras-related protein Rab-11A
LGTLLLFIPHILDAPHETSFGFDKTKKRSISFAEAEDSPHKGKRRVFSTQFIGGKKKKKMSESSTSMIFKLLIVGDGAVGKSNLMTRYISDEFSADSLATIGVEFMTKIVRIDGRSVKVQIWDTAGQERYRAMAKSVYNGAKGALIVYDIASKASFESVENWLRDIRTLAPSCQVFLVGNKCDLEHLRQVPRDVADRYARENGLSFLETSALSRTNVDRAFECLIRAVADGGVTSPLVGGGPSSSGGKQALHAAKAVARPASVNLKPPERDDDAQKPCPC